MHTHSIARPVLIGTSALAVLVAAGWAANTWPEVKHLATLVGIGVLAGMCSLGGLAALLLHLFGHEPSAARRAPQAAARAPHTRGVR